MKVSIKVELELAGDLSDEVFDVWAWALERQLEELELVREASVVDFEIAGAQ